MATADRDVVKPGEALAIEVVMQLKDLGVRRKAVYVETSAGSVVLRIAGEPAGRVVVEPEQLEWRNGVAGEKIVTIRLEGNGRIGKVLANAEGYEVSVVSIKDGRHYQLRVQPASSGDMVDGVLVVHTDPAFGVASGHRVFLWQLPGPDGGSEARESNKVTK